MLDTFILIATSAGLGAAIGVPIGIALAVAGFWWWDHR